MKQWFETERSHHRGPTIQRRNRGGHSQAVHFPLAVTASESEIGDLADQCPQCRPSSEPLARRDNLAIEHACQRTPTDRIGGLWPLFDNAADDIEQDGRTRLKSAAVRAICGMATQ